MQEVGGRGGEVGKGEMYRHIGRSIDTCIQLLWLL